MLILLCRLIMVTRMVALARAAAVPFLYGIEQLDDNGYYTFVTDLTVGDNTHMSVMLDTTTHLVLLAG